MSCAICHIDTCRKRVRSNSNDTVYYLTFTLGGGLLDGLDEGTQCLQPDTTGYFKGDLGTFTAV